MDVLAIVAHPDDESIFCGGTIAKHADRGDSVTIAFLTKGEYGGASDVENLADTRESEAKAAASRLGASALFLDFSDGHVEPTVENRFKIVELIRQEDPDVIVTHHSDDLHPDHRATSTLVTDAYYMATLPRVDVDADPCDPDNVYYFGKPTSDFEPTVRVDISEYQDVKEEAIEEHRSQIEWLENHGGIDGEFESILEDVRAQARIRGKECGASYAEGFETLHEVPTEYLS
jgi:bacillithiol biosynthesis deacetylase BshB1